MTEETVRRLMEAAARAWSDLDKRQRTLARLRFRGTGSQLSPQSEALPKMGLEILLRSAQKGDATLIRNAWREGWKMTRVLIVLAQTIAEK